MNLPRFALLALLLGSFLCPAAAARPAGTTGSLALTPAGRTLDGRDSRQQLILSATSEGRVIDRTREALFRSETPGVVAVSEGGLVTPVADGTGLISARFAGQTARTSFKVVNSARPRPATFERDILPILARAGCNSGSCHGKARGQNGFQLSLLGFDPDFDHAALVSESRGRRIFHTSPESSLLLRKGAGLVPHGGGKRLQPGDGLYGTLLRWVQDGAPRTPAGAPTLERIQVEPGERVLAYGGEQQLLVTAHYSDGQACDVTHLATFQSSESVIGSVSPTGLVKAGPLPGEAAIMARFLEKFAVCNILIPKPGSVPATIYARLPRNNFIDEHAWNKLQRLGLTPSEPIDAAKFLRRVHLDVIGRLPTPAETRAFLADSSPDKRMKLVDHLLERPEYADYWAGKWADLLRPNPYRVGIKATYNLDAWLRDAFRRNLPHDQFVRAILTARGSTFRNGPAVVFRDRREPDEITTMVSQLFLGIRLDCARCHHHPFEVWSQDDFYSFAAYFGRLRHKGAGLSPPISGGEEVIFTAPEGQVRHPVSGRVMTPRPLFGKAPPLSPERDPRETLAEWIVSPENPYFARVQVNRLWADLMGRGLVEPVDDLRATNPASNQELLNALASDFRKNGCDNKKLLRTILTSHVYSLSSLPGPGNSADTRNYSRHYRQRLRAEVLLDAASDITGISESFSGLPPGARAAEVWTARIQSVFLDSFGRPDPNQDPPCERSGDTTVVQALHLMNAPALHRKVTDDAGRATRLAESKMTPAEIVEELYLLAYSRFPEEDEKNKCLAVFAEKGVSRRQATEDILWALLNTPEFVFKD